MLSYSGTVIRPPSEADSLILQITLGCSDNACVFCPAYKDKKFKIKDVKEIEADIEKAGRYYPYVRKVFLADGDALIIPQKDLIRIFDKIISAFKYVSRISLYASVKSIEFKTHDELKELRARKMSLVYIGFETGDEQVYRLIKKYGSAEQNAGAVLKLKEASIKSNVTVILGLGGVKFSKQHAENTALILNKARPEQIAALTLMVAKNTPLYEMCLKKEFETVKEFGILKELKIIIEKLEDFPCLFFSNHASNYVPISARFPKDRQNVINMLNKVIEYSDKSMLRNDFLRSL